MTWLIHFSIYGIVSNFSIPRFNKPSWYGFVHSHPTNKYDNNDHIRIHCRPKSRALKRISLDDKQAKTYRLPALKHFLASLKRSIN